MYQFIGIYKNLTPIEILIQKTFIKGYTIDMKKLNIILSVVSMILLGVGSAILGTSSFLSSPAKDGEVNMVSTIPSVEPEIEEEITYTYKVYDMTNMGDLRLSREITYMTGGKMKMRKKNNVYFLEYLF